MEDILHQQQEMAPADTCEAVQLQDGFPFVLETSSARFLVPSEA